MVTYFICKFLLLSIFLLFCSGLVRDRDNILVLFLYFELMLLVGGVVFILESFFLQTVGGLLFFIYILTFAAIKAAIGISIIVAYVKYCNTLNC